MGGNDEHYRDERHRAFVALMERVLKLEAAQAAEHRRIYRALSAIIDVLRHLVGLPVVASIELKVSEPHD